MSIETVGWHGLDGNWGIAEKVSQTYPIQHDVRGRISTAPDLDLTYDVYNRLVGAQRGTQWEAYLYDGDGLMVGRQTSSGDFEHYAWDGNQLVGAYDLNGVPKWEAVFGAGQDELLAFYDYITGTDYLPVRDWRNNVVAAYDAGAEGRATPRTRQKAALRRLTWLGTSCVRKRARGACARCQVVCRLRSTANGARH